MSHTDKSPPEPPFLLKNRDFWVFFIPSLIGIVLFLSPIKTSQGFSIPIAIMANALSHLLAGMTGMIIAAIIWISAIASVIASILKPHFVTKNAWLNTLLIPGIGWLLVRICGAVFATQCFFLIGPDAVCNKDTGLLVFNELLPILFTVFIFAGLFLPFLLNFGLLEFSGTLATKIMRPLFNLPGRSAIDCCTSWLGDGSLGIILTTKQFEQGYYTQREAAVIATNFSVVSITFSLVVLTQVNLQQHFLPFYLTVCVCGIACAIILPRIPPLSLKPDTYIDGSPSSPCAKINTHESLFKQGFKHALAKAATITSFKEQVLQGLENAIGMLFSLLPVVMAIGTFALMVSEYTVIFEWLGKPFTPILELLHIPEAAKASETIMAGFADMFLPSILSSTIDSPMTRFFIAALSVTQLIYLSEVGALILGSKIPINFVELCIIFLLRTVVCIPIIAVMTHLFF